MSRAQHIIELLENIPKEAVKTIAKKVKEKAFSGNMASGHKIPSSGHVKGALKTVSSIPHDPDAAKKVAHALVGSAALAAATGALAGRRRRKRREREMSYRGSSGYYE